MSKASTSIEKMEPKRIGGEVIVGGLISAVVTALLAKAASIEILNVALVAAASIAAVLCMVVAHSWGEGVANLVGEKADPGVRYYLTYSSICAVVVVVTFSVVGQLIGY